jgi:pyroglutamyl-peptidase
MRPAATILLTGFEPYGALPANPAFDAMRALDGETVSGFAIVGRALPVSLGRIETALADAIAATTPAAFIALGMAPGEPAIRLERVGLNLADFALPDNDGAIMMGRPLAPGGPAARWATLPLGAIHAALLAAGIPARLSETAGTYLCNACLYLSLMIVERPSLGIPCGFIHLPMTPELAVHASQTGAVSAFDRLPPASMELSRIVTAVRIALVATAEEIQRNAARNETKSAVT